MKQHSPRFLALVNQTKSHITEISPETLNQKISEGVHIIIIDVREDNEWSNSGHIPQALHMGRGIIERDIEKIISDLAAPIVVYCSGGFRCALVAQSLQTMGYSNVLSLAGGLQGWIDAGFPTERTIA